MGFRKTEKGNVIYDFDFTPTKLVPLSVEETGGPYSYYRVEGPNGEIAPVEFGFQGERYGNYGFAFGTISDKSESERLGKDLCVCTNVMIVATLASLYDRNVTDEDFDPWSANSMALKGIVFDIMGIDVAKKFMERNKYPKDGYKTLNSEIL